MLKYFLFFFLIPFLACNKRKEPAKASELPPLSFIKGADLSFLPEIESSGTRFFDQDSLPSDVLTIFKNKGCNTIRIRIWNKPADVHSSLDEVFSFSKIVKQKGMKVWLDFHYSDTWADPGQQTKPAAWASLDQNTLCDSVFAYTKRVMLLINPDYVQIGNEINDGLLWDNGKLSLNPANGVQLLKSGVRAVREVDPKCKIIMHYAGQKGADWFYDILKTNAVDYDIMGLSYYPIWHGYSLDTLQIQLQSLNTKFNKPIVIAETAYPFTLAWNDYTNNVVGLSNQLIPGYPATPEGQLKFLTELKNKISTTPNGLGFCYWGAEWVSFKGPTATNGSNAENQALFNFNNRALPALEVFGK